MFPRFIATDYFNAWLTAWGGDKSGHRGDALCTYADALGLIVVNCEWELTFHERDQGSIVNVWRVRTEVSNDSDHLYISFSYDSSRSPF